VGLVSVSKHPRTSCHGSVWGDSIARDLFCTVEASPTWNWVEIFAGLHWVPMSQLHWSLFSAALGVVVSEARTFLWHEICQGLQSYSEGRSLLLLV